MATLLLAWEDVVNKVGAAEVDQVTAVESSIHELNPQAVVVRANSVVSLSDPELVRGRRVLVVEDGPTLTHGGMKFGAGVVAARRAGASEIVDPRPFVTGTIAEVFGKYDVGPVLPAEGYSPEQLGELERAIASTPCDTIVIGTPMDLRHVIRLTKPVARVSYELQELGPPTLVDLLRPVITGARRGVNV
jgi:predicted GTPase